MFKTRFLRTVLFLAVGAMVLPGVLLAQPTVPPPGAGEGFSPPFNFSPPGARALGMGSTFIGIADDATAAEANPAGLTILSRPEISLHWGSSDYQIDAIDPTAVVSGQIIESNGGQFEPQDYPGPVVTFDDSVSALSFASYVQPANRWVFSLYYAQELNFQGSTMWQGLDTVFIDQFTSTLDQDILLENIGLSTAYRASDNFSIGLSVRYSSMDLNNSDTWRVDYFNDFEFFIPGFIESGAEDSFRLNRTVNDSDSDITFNAGLLFNPNGTFSVGAVYEQGGSFEFQGTQEAFWCWNWAAQGFNFQCDPVNQTGNGFFPVEGNNEPIRATIDVPDVYGIGFAWRPTDSFLLAADVVQVTWSDLGRSFDDETEIHLGLEYTVIAGQTPISLRAGAYENPDHDGSPVFDSSEDVFTAGLGFVFGGNFQLDLAGAFGDQNDFMIVSGVYRF